MLVPAGETPRPADTPVPPGETPRPAATPAPPDKKPRPADTPASLGETPRPADTPAEPGETPRPADTPAEPGETPRPADTPAEPGETPRSADIPVAPDGTPRPVDTPALAEEVPRLADMSDLDGEGLPPEIRPGVAPEGLPTPAGRICPLATATVLPRRSARPGSSPLNSAATGSVRSTSGSLVPVAVRTSPARAFAPLIMRPATVMPRSFAPRQAPPDGNPGHVDRLSTSTTTRPTHRSRRSSPRRKSTPPAEGRPNEPAVPAISDPNWKSNLARKRRAAYPTPNTTRTLTRQLRHRLPGDPPGQAEGLRSNIAPPITRSGRSSCRPLQRTHDMRPRGKTQDVRPRGRPRTRNRERRCARPERRDRPYGKRKPTENAQTTRPKERPKVQDRPGRKAQDHQGRLKVQGRRGRRHTRPEHRDRPSGYQRATGNTRKMRPPRKAQGIRPQGDGWGVLSQNTQDGQPRGGSRGVPPPP
jgi:hypothetical protein